MGPNIGPKVGVVTFPGSLDDQDALRAIRLCGGEPVSLWHGSDALDGVGAVILPGGFSYGDYLRCGAISRFAPVMAEVIKAAEAGMPVLGICNGFQILCEAHLLPGALIRNDVRVFVCKDQDLQVESVDTTWTSDFTAGQIINIVLKQNVDLGISAGLIVGAANRDPKRFPDPEKFDIERKDNQHVGWGRGVHSCIGGPLARLEVNIALETFLRRVENPRLVVDPPPYRQNQIFRGPLHLEIEFDQILP